MPRLFKNEADRQNGAALGLSILTLLLLALFGGSIIGGALVGFGAFIAMAMIVNRKRNLWAWAKKHPFATEIISTLGTFLFFSVFAEGTIVAVVAAIVCSICVSAMLGLSYFAGLRKQVIEVHDWTTTKGAREFQKVVQKSTKCGQKKMNALLRAMRKREENDAFEIIP